MDTQQTDDVVSDPANRTDDTQTTDEEAEKVEENEGMDVVDGGATSESEEGEDVTEKPKAVEGEEVVSTEEIAEEEEGTDDTE